MLTEAQRAIIGRHLSPRTGDDLTHPTCSVTLTKSQLAFIIEAIDNFHRTQCPKLGGQDGCQLMSWYENPATGAMELECDHTCIAWRDEIIAQVVPQAFPAPEAAPAGAGAVVAASLAEPRFVPAD
jgi:hypothetical protein